MFGAFDWQLVQGVVVDHERNAAEGLAELTQNVSAILSDRSLGVIETSAYTNDV